MKISFDKKYFRKYERETHSIHEPVPVTYQTFIVDGKKILQIDGYNSKVNIQDIGTLKQSDYKMQFDKETAAEFIKLIRNELGI